MKAFWNRIFIPCWVQDLNEIVEAHNFIQLQVHYLIPCYGEVNAWEVSYTHAKKPHLLELLSLQLINNSNEGARAL